MISVIVHCIWEHNSNDTLLYCVDLVGAYTRGESLEIAMSKMKNEVSSYNKWLGKDIPAEIVVEVVEDWETELLVSDADSEVIFKSEKEKLILEEYRELKTLALKSAKDLLILYNSIADKDKSVLPERKSFYGPVPRTANEMYEHTKNVNEYYFNEIGIDADNDGDIYECRLRGFERVEQTDGFLDNLVVDGSYGEEWSLRKVIRRFIWHDRIHAKAMWKMAVKTFGESGNPFCF